MPSKHFCVKVDQRLEEVASEDLPLFTICLLERGLSFRFVGAEEESGPKKRKLLQIS
jgi:hypothetical protein